MMMMRPRRLGRIAAWFLLVLVVVLVVVVVVVASSQDDKNRIATDDATASTSSSNTVEDQCANLNTARVFREISPSVVGVLPPSGSGTGIIVDSSHGLVITTEHVLRNDDKKQQKEQEVSVFPNDKRCYVATVLGSDPIIDVIVLQLETSLVVAGTA